MNAQKTLHGEYRLTGIPETASAFMFKPDGRFEFFFIYGAVDRAATGTYLIIGDTIKLHSDKSPGDDFPITKEKKQGKGYVIKVSDLNNYLVQNILCIYYIGGTENVTYTDENGMITIDAKQVDRIYLRHELFPDIPTLIKDENNQNNYFEVSLSPTLVNVSFKGIDFTIHGNSISCLPNYVMPFEKIKYVRQ